MTIFDHPRGSRLMRIRLPHGLMPRLLQRGLWHRFQVISGLPPDAILIDIFREQYSGIGELNLVFFHDDFPALNEGDTIPELPLVLEPLP